MTLITLSYRLSNTKYARTFAHQTLLTRLPCRPSAIFRLRGTHIPSSQSSAAFAASSDHLSATLGIMCEPIPSVEAQVAALGAGRSAEVPGPSSSPVPSTSTALVLARSVSPPDAVALAQKVALNLFNHVRSLKLRSPHFCVLTTNAGRWVRAAAA